MDVTIQDFIRWFNTPIIHVGGSPLTVSGMGASLVIVVIAIMISAVVRKAISSPLKDKLKLDAGISYTIERFVHYTILVVGIVVACQSIGLNLGSLAVVFGFLSVGIGFGLQNITSNFISGLILLIERPISVGDFIDVKVDRARVKFIGMRSTTVMTTDNIAVIVPNSHLIENEVTNWSVGDQRVRLHCTVGVAYGSDIPLVKQALLDVAKKHKDVIAKPGPLVRFLKFDDSSLNFDLLVWVKNPLRLDDVPSEINYMIDASFREKGIQIPFPQRDVHMQLTPAIERLSNAGMKVDET